MQWSHNQDLKHSYQPQKIPPSHAPDNRWSASCNRLALACSRTSDERGHIACTLLCLTVWLSTIFPRSVHAIVYMHSSTLLLTSIPCIDIPVWCTIHWVVGTGLFPVWGCLNNAAVNIHIRAILWTCFHYLRKLLSGFSSMIGPFTLQLMVKFKSNPHMSFWSAVCLTQSSLGW